MSIRFGLSMLFATCALSPSYTFAGAGSGGGGNSVNGHLVESYSKNIKDLSGYVQVVEPLLNHLDKVIPSLGTWLRTNMNAITWYLVPATLKFRSEEITGLPFPSDQVRNGKKLWI